jgi:phage/plasmid-associated DNA primase
VPVNINNATTDNLNVAEISDPDIKEIRNMLRALNPERYIKYEYWFKILCSLQSKGDKYKEVAREFTFNVLKHNPHSSKPSKFESTWNSIKRGSSQNKININTLYYYCQKDNPELYSQMKNETILSDLLNKIVKDDNDGNFTEIDYAKILRTLLGYKFCSVEDGSNNKVWYEFITEDDFCEEGQIYKWIKTSSLPNKMVVFIADMIPKLLKRLEDFYSAELKKDRDAPKEITKHINEILKNIKMQKRNLGSKTTINNIIRLASSLFNERQLDKIFMSKLDKYDNCLGVGNGILVLGEEPKLVTGYHDLIISKYSKVSYYPTNVSSMPNIGLQIPRNVENPFFEKLDKFFKSYYLDSEQDVLEFEMMFLASSLDFKIKVPVFFFKKGNGKNGKSTLMEFMKAILGDYCRKLDIGMLVQGRTNADSASPAKMQLDGARLVYYSESEKDEELFVAKMKEFLGCETITGRKLHQDQVEFKPRCNHAVTSNHNFIIKTKDHGTWRRIYYYEYKIRFVEDHEYDPTDKFQRLVDSRWIGEYIFNPQCQEAFLSILVDCYKKYMTVYDGNLSNVYSPTMEMEKERYRNEQDFMNKFITEKCVYSPASTTSFENFAEAYATYYKKYKGIVVKYADIETDIITSYLKDFVINKEITKHRIIDNDICADELTIKDFIAMEKRKKADKMNKRVERKMKEVKEENNSEVAMTEDIVNEEGKSVMTPVINDGYIEGLDQLLLDEDLILD